MASVQDLKNSFSHSCVSDVNKTVGKLMDTAKYGIKNFNVYLQGKQYRKKVDREATDRNRYNAMMTAIVTYLQNYDSDEYKVKPADVAKFEAFHQMLSDRDSYFSTLTDVFTSDDAFEVFEGNFMKGSAKALGLQFNRFFNPKKSEDSVEAVGTLEDYVKTYAVGFANDLSESKTHTYVSTTLVRSAVEKVALDMMESGVDLFVAQTEGDGPFVTLWVTDSEVTGEDITSIDATRFMGLLDDGSFELHPIHFVSLDVVKKDFMMEKYDLFVSHANILSKSTPIVYQKGVYKYADGYNDIDESRIGNSINGFPQRHIDVKRNVFASFTFNGELGNVTIDSYWLFTGDPKEILGDAYESYEWTDLTVDEFITNMKDDGTIGRSLLH